MRARISTTSESFIFYMMMTQSHHGSTGLPISRLQQLRQDFQDRRKAENRVKLKQIVTARRLKDREHSVIQQPVQARPRQHKSSYKRSYKPQVQQRRTVRSQLQQRRSVSASPDAAPATVPNALDLNPHNLLPAIGSNDVAAAPGPTDAPAPAPAAEEQTTASARSRSKTPGRTNDRYSKSRGASRGRAAPAAAQPAGEYMSYVNNNDNGDADNFPAAPTSPAAAHGVHGHSHNGVPCRGHHDEADAELPAAHAAAPTPVAVPTKTANAASKKTKKQKQEELKAAKEQARKDSIAARKKKRDDMHRARAVEREARRQREEAERAASEGADEVAGELFSPSSGAGAASPSRDTVVSIGDRVVFNETSAEGLPVIDRVYHENSVTEQLDEINNMSDSELPMSPRKTPLPSEAMPPPPYPVDEFPATAVAAPLGTVARSPSPEDGPVEPEQEAVPIVTRTGLVPASERKKMAQSKTPDGPPPTALKSLKIKTGVVKRLNKEAQAYRKEGAQQMQKLVSLRDEAFQDFEASKMEEVVEETIRVVASVEDKLAAGIMDLIAIVEETPALEGSEEHSTAMEVLKVAREEADARMHDKLRIPDVAEKEAPKPKKGGKKKKGAGRKSKTPTLPKNDEPASPHRPTASEISEMADAAAEAKRHDEAAPNGKKGAKVRGRASKATKKAKSPVPAAVATPLSPAATAAEKDERTVAMSPIAMNGGAADAYLAQLDAFGSEAQAPVVNLKPCSCCGRKFNPDRLEKHEVACKASKEKAAKRKVFDQSKARLQGTDAAQFVGKKSSKANEKKYEKAKEKKKNWKLKSEQFRAGLKAARDPNAAPAAPVVNPDYVQCPHCSRNFNEAAAERHMPRCAESSARSKGNKAKGKARAKYDPRKKK
eukprot:gene7062-33092_t